MNAAELKKRMAALTPKDDNLPAMYTWDRHRYELRRHMARGDDLDTLLRWSTMIATMVVLDAPYIKGEFRDTPRWLIPDEVDFGGIERLPWATWTSGNAVHQAYHLWQWMKRSQQVPGELERVFEFGGGYGAMCRMFRRQGFQGEYMVYDVPEFSLIQEYYLSNVAPHDGNRLVTKLPIVEEPVDLFIGMYSMSEVPIALRTLTLNAVPAKSYLFAYQEHYKDYDNAGWFRGLTERYPELRWEIWSNPHLGLTHWYAVGVPCS